MSPKCPVGGWGPACGREGRQWKVDSRSTNRRFRLFIVHCQLSIVHCLSSLTLTKLKADGKRKLFPVRNFSRLLAWRFCRLREALPENGDNTTRANLVRCSRHRPLSDPALPKAWEEYPVSQQQLDRRPGPQAPERRSARKWAKPVLCPPIPVAMRGDRGIAPRYQLAMAL